jgi:hypothetical protein
MAAAPGYKGFVSSWATPNDTTLALFKPMAFTCQINGEEYDSTGFASGGQAVRSRVKGVRDWTVELDAYNATPTAGHLGNFTGTNIYATNPRGWDITINSDSLDTTPFQPSGDWRTFSPGLVSWQLNYECFVDTSTSLSMPDAAAGTTASFTATVSSGNTLAGTVVVTGCNPVIRVGDVSLVRYSCVGTGHLTTVGTGNVLPANSGTMTIPSASELILKTYDDGSDKTLTGNAFWTSLRVSTVVGQGVSFNASLRGTGALTPG